MDSLVRTRDSTVSRYGALDRPTMVALGRHTEAHKIGKAERTPMAHTGRTGITRG